jgi:hypothetical protein
MAPMFFEFPKSFFKEEGIESSSTILTKILAGLATTAMTRRFQR